MRIATTIFDPNPYWEVELENADVLRDSTCISLFDQNGYHLTKAEQSYADINGYPKNIRRHETVIRQPWITYDKYDGAHINHSDLFERKAYSGAALEQLNLYAVNNPMLYKLIKMKPKWGIDISIDYVSANAVFEVFHYEWDSFEYEAIAEKKLEIEKFVLSQDWDDVANRLWQIKDEWFYLDFFEQTNWRTNYFGLSPEKFKNVIWSI